MINPSVLTKLITLLGDKNIITDKNDMAPYVNDWRGHYQAEAAAVLLPPTTEMVSQIMALADQDNLHIVPQGGNTGLVGGGIPDNSGGMVILSLARMTKIRNLSCDNATMEVEAGCILENIHNEAAKYDLYFPLNLAAKGSCTIGGNLSTNAGGINVLRYGNTRDLCLGLEVVLMGGKVMNLLTPLRKDNTGYDLKQLFIGAEGTLGIITAASLKLFPLPKARATALAKIASPQAGVKLLSALKQATGDLIEAFEIMPHDIFAVVEKQFPAMACPIKPIPDFAILMEIASSDEDLAKMADDGAVPIIQKLGNFLSDAFEKQMISDAVIAQNDSQRQAMWDIREHAPESTKRESTPVNTDVSVPLSEIGRFYQTACDNVRAIDPDIRICGYGHLGDGNIHFNLVERVGGDPAWSQKRAALFDAIYQALYDCQGSISAEHGIGVMKAEQLKLVKDPVALEVMHQIKKTLDPKGLLNPGKIFT
ncbi:MAG: FAD-binding oxidoreductase [Candidatus Puniceispirillaceae bacterium]